MKVIVLAGGRGSRLPVSAQDIPKPLVAIGGKPIIEHQINLLESHGFSDIRFTLHYKAELIINYLNGRYEYILEPEPLGTGGAIKYASHDLTEPFMVSNGDIISNVDLQKFAASNKPETNSIVVAYHRKNTDFGMLNIDTEGKVAEFREKPETPEDGYVNVGFYILHPDILKNHPQTKFSLEYDLFPRLARDGRLYSFEHTEFWSDAGTEERLAEVRARFS